jgi:hypothetical protein
LKRMNSLSLTKAQFQPPEEQILRLNLPTASLIHWKVWTTFKFNESWVPASRITDSQAKASPQPPWYTEKYGLHLNLTKELFPEPPHSFPDTLKSMNTI